MNPKAVFSLIRALYPKAPLIGTKQAVFLGVCVRNGTLGHTVVAGPEDEPRECVILGYRIELGEACGFWPNSRQSVNVLVKVRPTKRCRLIEKELLCHISCLKRIGRAQLDKAARPA